MRRLTPVLAAMAALAIAGPSPVPAQMGGQVGGAPMGGRPGSGPPAGETGFEGFEKATAIAQGAKGAVLGSGQALVVKREVGAMHGNPGGALAQTKGRVVGVFLQIGAGTGLARFPSLLLVAVEDEVVGRVLEG